MGEGFGGPNLDKFQPTLGPDDKSNAAGGGGDGNRNKEAIKDAVKKAAETGQSDAPPQAPGSPDADKDKDKKKGAKGKGGGRVKAPRRKANRNKRAADQERAWNEKNGPRGKEVLMIKDSEAAGSHAGRLFIKRGLSPGKVNELLPLKAPEASKQELNPDGTPKRMSKGQRQKETERKNKEEQRVAITEKYATDIVPQMRGLLEQINAFAKGPPDKLQEMAKRISAVLTPLVGTLKKGDRNIPRELLNVWVTCASQGLVVGDEQAYLEARKKRYEEKKLAPAEIQKRMQPAVIKAEREGMLLGSLRQALAYGKTAAENEAYNNEPARKLKNDGVRAAISAWQEKNPGKRLPKRKEFELDERKTGFPGETLPGILLATLGQSDDVTVRAALPTINADSLRGIAADDKRYPRERRLEAKDARKKAAQEEREARKAAEKLEADYKRLEEVKRLVARLKHIETNAGILATEAAKLFIMSNTKAQWLFNKDGTRSIPEAEEAKLRGLPKDERPLIFNTAAQRGSFNTIVNRDMKLPAETVQAAAKELASQLAKLLAGPAIPEKRGLLSRVFGSDARPDLPVAIANMDDKGLLAYEKLKRDCQKAEERYVAAIKKLMEFADKTTPSLTSNSEWKPEVLSQRGVGAVLMYVIPDALLEVSQDHLVKEQARRAQLAEVKAKSGGADREGLKDALALVEISKSRGIFEDAVKILRGITFTPQQEVLKSKRDQLVTGLEQRTQKINEAVQAQQIEMARELSKTYATLFADKIKPAVLQLFPEQVFPGVASEIEKLKIVTE